MTNSLLQLHKLTKEYLVQGKRHIVLDNLSLTLDTTKITVILGRSGCGKTTLLRLIVGLEQPTTGEILLASEIKPGFMFQEARLMPWLNCYDNIALGAAEAKDTIPELLQITGLSSFASAYPHQLSGGMQQRVALARTLATRSKLILMDEPFAALDYFTRMQMQQELLKLHRLTHTGIILVTHNIEEALILADTILVLQEGKISLELKLPETEDRDILLEPYISYKKQLLGALSIRS